MHKYSFIHSELHNTGENARRDYERLLFYKHDPVEEDKPNKLW